MLLKLPLHVGLTIDHNPHKLVYEDVPTYLGGHGAPDVEPRDRDERALANEIWEIRWYPNTPIGFCVVAAATLERALELAGG